MATEQRLIPINQVYRQTDRVNFNIPFPTWLETDRIGVDLRRTLGLMTLGGIRSLTMTQAKTDEENSVSMPVIVGINTDGSALAGKAKAARKTLYHSGLSLQREFFPLHNCMWTNLGIRLNTDQIQKEITSASNNLRQPDSWTPYLDRVLRESIRKGGTHHLLKGHTVFRAFFALINNSLYLSALRDPKVILGVYFGWFAMGLFLELRTKELSSSAGCRYRATIIPGYEIDRAALLQVLSRTMILVKAIKPEVTPQQSTRNP